MSQTQSTRPSSCLIYAAIFHLLALFPAGTALSQAQSEKIILHETTRPAQVNHKISADLRALTDESTGLTGDALKRSGTLASSRGIDTDGKVQTYIYLSETGQSTIKRLLDRNVELEIVNAEAGLVQAWVPLTRLQEVATLDAVLHIRPPDYAINMSGSVNTEGDALLKANLVRIGNSRDGSGIRVGVISNGVDSRSQAQSTADLPSAIDIDPSLQGSGDEATAMLEIVHDLAPGADLAFSGPETSVEMLDAIDYLANDAFGGEGCDVIVDDLGFLGEPFFQDGALATKVDQVVAQGVTYVTAVGNQARVHYERDYVAGSLTIEGTSRAVHDFGRAASGASDVGQRMQVDDGTTLTVVLQWNEPYFNPSNDYDLIIMNAAMTQILALSNDVQDGGAGQFAIEVARYENTGTVPVNVNVVVQNLSASTNLLEMHYTGDGFQVQEFNVRDGSVIPGQQSAQGSIAVAAISVLDPGFDTIEGFSSLGPVRLFFPAESRSKPDITAADAVRITGAGGFGIATASGTRFLGTSAAAPHIAAIAALLLEGHPSLTPAQIKNALLTSADDRGTPGHDFTYGAGVANAQEAFDFIITSVRPDGQTPVNFSLGLNFPNPFNPSTTIVYAISQADSDAMVELEIFNTLGQRIRTLVSERVQIGGNQVTWDGRDDDGGPVASGIYLYRLTVGNARLANKMLLLR